MRFKNTILTLSLLAATAIAVSGCDGTENLIDTAGRDLSSSADVIPATEPTGDDTIVPENTSPQPTETPVTPDEEGPAGDVGGDAFCPTGTVSQGSPYLCCRIDAPQVCFFVDPGPGGGGGRPHLADHLPVNAELVDDSRPTPPDSGGTGGGGGGMDTSPDLNCYHDDPNTSRRVKLDESQTGTQADVLSTGCTML